ncbi:uncharacterized protein LOC135829417 [Sycon ciliatum]|uniref:uncharacterized protein LOC135829417 n=1 Tax=Sycon ciliatum TaxID=27933 RepID=UPI0031F6F69E
MANNVVFPLILSAVVTLALLITVHAVPKWYEETLTDRFGNSRKHNTGIWRECQELKLGGASKQTRCTSFVITTPKFPASLRSAQSFSLIATIFTGIALISTLVIEYDSTKVGLLRLPNIFFAVSGIAISIAALSFVAFINQDANLQMARPSVGLNVKASYGASFIIAWITLVPAFAAALLAHVHHSAKAASA